jgi:hypothetical protein
MAARLSMTTSPEICHRSLRSHLMDSPFVSRLAGITPLSFAAFQQLFCNAADWSYGPIGVAIL